MTSSSPVAIIGGGFSGTAVAVGLLESDAEHPIDIQLFDERGAFARGTAYSTPSDRHLLNVPAGNMSMFPDRPADLVEWLAERGTSYDPRSFIPRPLYGTYLEERLERAVGEASRSRFERIDERVESIRRDETGWVVVSNGGRERRAAAIVLALGNFKPASHFISAPGTGVFADPWRPETLSALSTAKSMTILGASLTAVDILIEAEARGFRGEATVVSRHALLPRPHRLGLAKVPAPFSAGDSLRTAFRKTQIHRHFGESDWRQIVESLRAESQSMWRAFSLVEKRRFLRRLRTYWDVHRHRIAPEIHEKITAMTDTGRVRLVAGSVTDVAAGTDSVRVTVRERGSSATMVISSDIAINCTGPALRLDQVDSPLLADLFESGVAMLDDLGIGLRADEQGALVSTDGAPIGGIYTLGPLRKGELWESVAVPELRVQAALIARTLSKTATFSGTSS